MFNLSWRERLAFKAIGVLIATAAITALEQPLEVANPAPIRIERPVTAHSNPAVAKEVVLIGEESSSQHLKRKHEETEEAKAMLSLYSDNLDDQAVIFEKTYPVMHDIIHKGDK